MHCGSVVESTVVVAATLTVAVPSSTVSSCNGSRETRVSQILSQAGIIVSVGSSYGEKWGILEQDDT